MFKAIIELLAAFFKSADTAGRIAEKSLPTPETRAEMDKRSIGVVLVRVRFWGNIKAGRRMAIAPQQTTIIAPQLMAI